MAHELPELGYEYNALEPHIDEKTMTIHHTKHHQGYTNKLNAALEGTGLEDKPVEELLKDLSQVPEDKRTAVRNNGGGFVNHTLFWNVMAPNAGGEPSGALAEAINAKWGNFNAFKEAFSAAAMTIFGSGWAWLIVTVDGELEIAKLPNQDSPFLEGNTPILGIDMWEHAFYVSRQNRKNEYVDAWWNVVNWDQVAKYFEEAKQ